MTTNKYKKLAIGLVMDAIGMGSFALPGIGEISDIAWAPISAYVMTKLYPGGRGKLAGSVAFIEELMPGLDVIPTFTLTWLYTYVWSSSTKEAEHNSPNVVEID